MAGNTSTDKALNGPAWLNFVMKVGVPSAIALGLTYFLTQHVDGQLHALTTALNTHVQQMVTDQSELRFFLRQICLNTAESEAERAGCIGPSSR